MRLDELDGQTTLSYATTADDNQLVFPEELRHYVSMARRVSVGQFTGGAYFGSHCRERLRQERSGPRRICCGWRVVEEDGCEEVGSGAGVRQGARAAMGGGGGGGGRVFRSGWVCCDDGGSLGVVYVQRQVGHEVTDARLLPATVWAGDEGSL